MLNFDQEVVCFKFKGVEREIRKPTNGDIKKYNEDLKKCKTDESKEKQLLFFLEELGLCGDLYNEMNPQQVKILIENLYEAEKN